MHTNLIFMRIFCLSILTVFFAIDSKNNVHERAGSYVARMTGEYEIYFYFGCPILIQLPAPESPKTSIICPPLHSSGTLFRFRSVHSILGSIPAVNRASISVLQSPQQLGIVTYQQKVILLPYSQGSPKWALGHISWAPGPTKNSNLGLPGWNSASYS